MALQQAHFAETIRAMKVAMKRKPDDSDSDISIHAHTNRGNKLKRHAKFVREGHLDDTGGLAYRRKISHAGYTRAIIASNPRLYDEDGDVVSPTPSDVENGRVEGAEPVHDNAFGDVRLEELLRPLTSAAELPDHPSLSVAFKSQALTQMAEEALEMVRREKEYLWKAKRLLQRFRGDADWVPCERFEAEGDESLLLPYHETGPELAQDDPSAIQEEDMLDAESTTAQIENGNRNLERVGEWNKEHGADMEGIRVVDAAERPATGVEETAIHIRHTESGDLDGKENQTESNGHDNTTTEGKTQKDLESAGDRSEQPESTSLANRTISDIRDRDRDAEAASEKTSNSGKETNGTERHAMTTRARARSPVASDPPSPTPSDSASTPPVHPWFLPPSSSLPDRDLGLPASEADETRRMLLLYVQKQEQVVRALESLYSGLQKADRLRGEVFRSCKAEAHLRDDGKGNMVTEMSDGEDWYDVQEWKLQPWEMKMGKNGVHGLEKGKDEVEDAEEEGRRGGRRRRVNRM